MMATASSAPVFPFSIKVRLNTSKMLMVGTTPFAAHQNIRFNIVQPVFGSMNSYDGFEFLIQRIHQTDTGFPGRRVHMISFHFSYQKRKGHLRSGYRRLEASKVPSDDISARLDSRIAFSKARFSLYSFLTVFSAVMGFDLNGSPMPI